jgi:protein-tyrosine phosphatase
MTEADLNVLNQIGIKRICDLRGKDEIQQHPDPVCEGTLWVHTPVIPDDEEIVRQIGDLADPQRFLQNSEPGEALSVMNRQMVNYVETYQRIFASLLEEPDAPFLFHCMAGKDRTGVVGALILSVLGVPRENIIEDYLYTNHSLEKIKANLQGGELNKKFPSINQEVLEALLEAREEYITAFFDEIETRFGSVKSYLEEMIGLKEEEIKRLKESLLE